VVNIYLIVVNLLSLLINLSLAYFAVRLLLVFRGEKTDIGWGYVSLGVLALATSSSIFALYYILTLPSMIHPIAGVVMMIGDLLILLGLHEEYKRWQVSEHSH